MRVSFVFLTLVFVCGCFGGNPLPYTCPSGLKVEDARDCPKETTSLAQSTSTTPTTLLTSTIKTTTTSRFTATVSTIGATTTVVDLLKLRLGDAAEFPSVSATVKSAEIKDAYEKWDGLQQKYANKLADPGNTFILLDAVIVNTGGTPSYSHPGDFVVRDSGGRRYNPLDYEGDLPFPSSDIGPGGSAAGVILFQAPKTSGGFKAYYEFAGGGNESLAVWYLTDSAGDGSNTPAVCEASNFTVDGIYTRCGRYRFKIERVIYLTRPYVASIILDVKNPDGSVTQVQVSREHPEVRLDEMRIGVYSFDDVKTEGITTKAVIYVKKY